MSTNRHPTRSRSGRRRRDGGYVFVLVLVLISVAAITAGSAIDRASMQSHMAQIQIEGYEHYHELQGMRTLALLYLFRQDAFDLTEVANTGDPVRSIRFESGAVVNMYVQDGQGTVLRHLGDLPESTITRFLRELLGRLPSDRLDLTRTVGPWQIGLHGAPDEVLEAIAAGDRAIFEGLKDARKEKADSAGALIRILRQRGIEPAAAQAIARNLAFRPLLWRIDLELIVGGEVRYFTMLASQESSLPKLLQWRRLDDPAEIPGFGTRAGSWDE